jgi:hypothetical protein
MNNESNNHASTESPSTDTAAPATKGKRLITRRKLLASIGLAGVAAASAGLWQGERVSTAFAKNSSVTDSVYGDGEKKHCTDFAGSRISTTKFGVPVGDVSAVAKLQELIDKEVPIWIDGDHLIDSSLVLRNTDMVGPGKLRIVSDANFQVTQGSFVFADSAIAMAGGLGQYKVNLQFRAEFRNSAAGKPHTPFRFIGLTDSTIHLNCECWGSGDVTQTNLPDFYFFNNRVSIRGRYVVHQRIPGQSLGGMWVRDVYLGSDTSRRSSSVIVEDETYIENDGADEALSFFNPNTGHYQNCGVRAAVLRGRRIGLSFLNFSGNSLSASDVSGFAHNTVVIVDELGQGQGAVKADYTAPDIAGVQVFINGIDDVTTGATFASAFRNSNTRSDAAYPQLYNCKAYLNLNSQPTRELRAFDNPMHITNCEYWKLNTASFNYGVISKGSGTVNGGRYTGALTRDIENVSSAANCTPATHNNVKYASLRNRKGETVITTDANGKAQIQHSIFAVPTFKSAVLINAPARAVHLLSADQNYLYIQVTNPSTGNPDPINPFRVAWHVDG